MKTDVLLSIMAIASALFLVGGSTYAYFNDVEVAGVNNFTTGTLDLMVDNSGECTATMNFSNLKPGDSNDSAANWLITNGGSIAGNLSIEISSITNNENTITEPEEDVNDVTDGPNGGELGANLEVAFWMDVGGNGWGSEDYYLKPGGSVQLHDVTILSPGEYADLNDFPNTWSDVQTGIPGGNDFGNFYVMYRLSGKDTTSIIQTDDCTFDITFTLDQDQSQ